MTEIVLLHGVAEHVVREHFRDRTLVNRRSYEAYLSSRPPFVEWNDESDDGGDVLTIDDSTRAGAEACRIARRLGHAVTFFVNPENIVSGEPYYFSSLNAAIDASGDTAITVAGVQYSLIDYAARRQFRRAMKRRLLAIRGRDQRDRELASIFDALGVIDVAVPDWLLPPSVQDLRELRDQGVRIENHGWEHVEVSTFTEEEFLTHVVRGRKWLQRNIGIPATLYAVPFGETWSERFSRHVAGTWFLASRKQPAGRIAPRCWNRVEISDQISLIANRGT